MLAYTWPLRGIEGNLLSIIYNMGLHFDIEGSRMLREQEFKKSKVKKLVSETLSDKNFERLKFELSSGNMECLNYLVMTELKGYN